MKLFKAVANVIVLILAGIALVMIPLIVAGLVAVVIVFFLVVKLLGTNLRDTATMQKPRKMGVLQGVLIIVVFALHLWGLVIFQNERYVLEKIVLMFGTFPVSLVLVSAFHHLAGVLTLSVVVGVIMWQTGSADTVPEMVFLTMSGIFGAVAYAIVAFVSMVLSDASKDPTM